MGLGRTGLPMSQPPVPDGSRVHTTGGSREGSGQAAPAGRDLLPATHLVDAGYVTADQLVQSQAQHRVGLLGPTLGDSHWQARTPGAYDVDAFAVDWDAPRVTCPEGHRSVESTARASGR